MSEPAKIVEEVSYSYTPDPTEVAGVLSGFPVWMERPKDNESGERDEWDRRRRLERAAARAFVALAALWEGPFPDEAGSSQP